MKNRTLKLTMIGTVLIVKNLAKLSYVNSVQECFTKSVPKLIISPKARSGNVLPARYEKNLFHSRLKFIYPASMTRDLQVCSGEL